MTEHLIDFKAQMAQARRAQILQGAAQVFAEKGYHKATTKEIARSAGVSEGTIYNYFDTKRELLIAMIQLVGTRSLPEFFEAHADDPPADLFSALMWDRHHLMQERGQLLAPLLAELFTDPELRQAIYNQIARPLGRLLEQYIQRQIDAGRLRPVNPLLITRALLGAMFLNFGLKQAGMDPRYEDISPEAIIDELTTLFVTGLERR